MAATIEEWLQASNYMTMLGNENVILCERGIRTFETAYRFTLDITAVPVVKKLSLLPIIIDVSHPAGQADLVPALARAAVAVGADGIMVEVHPDPRSRALRRAAVAGLGRTALPRWRTQQHSGCSRYHDHLARTLSFSARAESTRVV